MSYDSDTASHISFTKESCEKLAVVVFSVTWGNQREMVLVDPDRRHRRDWAALELRRPPQAPPQAPPMTLDLLIGFIDFPGRSSGWAETPKFSGHRS